MFRSIDEAIDFVYSSYVRGLHEKGGSDLVRHPEFILDLIKILKLRIPENVVVVSGSKGKGTTAVLTASALSSQGIKVGIFTGPPLLDYAERIRVEGKAITHNRLLSILNSIVPDIEKLDRLLPKGAWLWHVGIFLLTALRYFNEEGVETVVLEGGRGALFDEVSAIQHTVSILSPIYFEHYEQLGPTIEDIAKNKAGIVHGSGVLVSAPQRPEVSKILRDRCELYGSKLLTYGEDFTTTVNSDGTFSLKTPLALYETLKMPFLGSYQYINAASALVAAEELLSRKIESPTVWDKIKWPGRMQMIESGGIRFLIDGTITKDSAVAVFELIKNLNIESVTTVVAVPKDKDYRSVIDEATKFSNNIIITEANNQHLIFPDDAFEYAKDKLQGRLVEFYGSLNTAIPRATELCEGGLVAILGTQSLVGDALKYFNISTNDIY